MSIGIKKPVRWWEKGLKPNMKEVTGAEDLVDSLLTAGDKLVVVDFFSPGCGGCKALHPKVPQNQIFVFVCYGYLMVMGCVAIDFPLPLKLLKILVSPLINNGHSISYINNFLAP